MASCAYLNRRSAITISCLALVPLISTGCSSQPRASVWIPSNAERQAELGEAVLETWGQGESGTFHFRGQEHEFAGIVPFWKVSAPNRGVYDFRDLGDVTDEVPSVAVYTLRAGRLSPRWLHGAGDVYIFAAFREGAASSGQFVKQGLDDLLCAGVVRCAFEIDTRTDIYEQVRERAEVVHVVRE